MDMLVYFMAVLLVVGACYGDSVDQLVEDFTKFRLDEAPEYTLMYGLDYNVKGVEEWNEEAFNRRKIRSEELQKRAVDLLMDKNKVLDKQIEYDLRILKANLDLFLEGDKLRHHTVPFNGEPVLNLETVMEWSNIEDELRLNLWYDRMALYINMLLEQARIIPSDAEAAKEYALPCIVVNDLMERMEAITNNTVDNFFAFKPWKNLGMETKNVTFYEAGKARSMQLKESLEQVHEAFKNNYTQACRQTVGVSALEEGREFYQQVLRFHTSNDMTPEKVRELGMKEVDRITKEIADIIKEEGFNTTIEYVNHLLSDPSETFSSPEAVISYLKDLYVDIKKLMPDLFSGDYYQDEMEIVNKPNGGLGTYNPISVDGRRPSRFNTDASKPREMLKVNMLPLLLHEGVPGHHLQISYTIHSGMANFRRLLEFRHDFQGPYNWPTYNAYIEGWGLYAEYLANELGLITNNQERIGKLSFESLRAVRLVVDTGLHYYNWTVDEAVQYMKERTTLPESECLKQVIRYIKLPGQACAYKVGELKIKELRKKAEEKLGEKFDIKGFHSAILRPGPSPLDIVEEAVNHWVEDELSKISAGNSIALTSQVIVGVLVIWNFI